jgi:predicted DNA binding protein
MREFTVRFWVPDGDLFGFSDAFADESDIERGETYRMEVLDDGTATNISACTGPAETVREVISGIDKVIDVKVAEGDPTFYYVHFEPTEVTREMMRARRETSLALQMPIEWQADGSVVASFVGDQSAFGEVLEVLPEGVEGEVLSIRESSPGVGGLTDGLTERQREVLRVATELGYYDDPRTATQADIAAELDITAATAGEHLRKIEAEILGSLGR